MRSSSPRRTVTLLLALAASALLLGGGPGTSSASADGPVTVSGSGPFSSLKVTVDQTTQLVNQVVHVTWTGGAPTQGQANFLQIMQCWGDEPTGPTREQCQFGGFQNQLGGWASTRQVFYGGAIRDTHETYIPPAGWALPYYVPFHPVDHNPDVPDGNTNQFYDANTTNEVARGVTYADGTGEAYFQVQTAREAPGLGCGAAIDDVTTPYVVEKERHGCYLVIVPRSNNELPGIETSSAGGVLTSPLSVTNWSQRLVITLSFQPIGASCPASTTEVPVYGTELVTDAVSSWQPTLCSTTSTAYSFTQVPDDLARSTTVSNDPSRSALGFVGGAVPADEVGGASLTYAPVTISAIGLGFLIERQSIYGASSAVQAQDGRRLPTIKMTPRLVAKLLTQSYVSGSPPRNDKAYQYVARAGSSTKQYQPLLAQSLGSDPEFLALNPDFLPLQTSLGSALAPYIPADSVSLLWQWVKSDKDARDFLAGRPDFASPWYNDCGQSVDPQRCVNTIDCSMFTDSRGVKGCPTYVNPAFQGMALPQPVIPKADTYCYQPELLPAQCTLDLFPYANGFADAANSTSRGDSLARTTYNGISYSKGPVQYPGSRNLISVTDTASADRFSLAMASLRNGAGEFVAPTDESMTVALGAMTKGTGGVLVPDPATKASGAYPLTTVTYAVVNRAALTADTRTAYSKFLQYVATDGQTPGITFGTLPAGYLPLPTALREQTVAAASTVAAPLPASTPTPTPTPTPGSSSDGGTTSTDGGSVPTTGDPGSTGGDGEPVVTPSGGTSASPSPSASPTTTIVTRSAALTQPVPAGLGALGAVVALLLGATAAVGAAVALGLASRGGR